VSSVDAEVSLTDPACTPPVAGTRKGIDRRHVAGDQRRPDPRVVVLRRDRGTDNLSEMVFPHVESVKTNPPGDVAAARKVPIRRTLRQSTRTHASPDIDRTPPSIAKACRRPPWRRRVRERGQTC